MPALAIPAAKLQIDRLVPSEALHAREIYMAVSALDPSAGVFEEMIKAWEAIAGPVASRVSLSSRCVPLTSEAVDFHGGVGDLSVGFVFVFFDPIELFGGIGCLSIGFVALLDHDDVFLGCLDYGIDSIGFLKEGPFFGFVGIPERYLDCAQILVNSGF